MQEWENLQALSVGVGVTYMLNLSQKSVESCPQKYQIFKAIRIWENARAADVFNGNIKKILADEKRRFHLEQTAEGNWILFEVKNGENKFLQTLNRTNQWGCGDV